MYLPPLSPLCCDVPTLTLMFSLSPSISVMPHPCLLGFISFSHSRIAMPTRKRRVAPSGADMQPRQKRPTAATSALGGPDIAPRVRGRPVTRRQVLPDAPAITGAAGQNNPWAWLVVYSTTPVTLANLIRCETGFAPLDRSHYKI